MLFLCTVSTNCVREQISSRRLQRLEVVEVAYLAHMACGKDTHALSAAESGVVFHDDTLPP